MPVRSIHVPLFKRGGNGQHDISVLHRFVEELIGADHHFQFFKRFFHLAAIEILGKRVFTGDPQHTNRRIVGLQNPLRRLVNIQGAIGVLHGVAASGSPEFTGGARRSRYANSAHRRLLQHGVIVKAPGMQMAITRAAAFDTDVAGHSDKGVDSANVGAAVDMTLHPVTNPDRGRVNRRKLFRQLANDICRQAADFCRPFHGDVIAQIGFKFRIAVSIVVDKILIHQAFIHQMTRHPQRQRAV